MVFYELVCIAKAKLPPTELASLVRIAAKAVLDNGGVVRNLTNMGIDRPLPQRIRSHQQWHTEGSYWMMHFDSNPLHMQELGHNLKFDRRVVRHTFIKLGPHLEDITERPDQTYNADVSKSKAPFLF